RGVENFAGNEFYIDHITIGGMPNGMFNSPCNLVEVEPEVNSFVEYFQDTIQQTINTGSTAGAVTTFALDTLCETLQISITDTVNAPLAAFNAYIVNPTDSSGNDIVDISGGVNVTMRVRSLEAVNVDILFRSGGGSSAERSDRKSVAIPAGLDEWTSFTITFDSSEYAGFNPADLRDMWFYLDRGVENFAGNEFYIDHIAIGGTPDEVLNSPCVLGDSGPVAKTFEEYFQDSTLLSVNTTTTAGLITTFTLDTICETLQISVMDPVSAPLPSFNAYFINPIDENGEEITNITGNVNVTMRVRSAETVTVDVLFRSGEGTSDERTNRKSFVVPGGLDEWNSFTLEFSESDLAGFDPATLRDMWFYLDRGTPNFAGNEFYIDHVTIGVAPDSTRFSTCSTEPEAQAWVENWDTANPTIFGGAETSKLTLTTGTECEELKIEVTDPANNPHQAFRPIVIAPTSPSGSPITNISDNVQLTMRVRSAAEVPIGVLFRSGDGSNDFRTATLTQNVEGTLEAWTTLTYNFSGEDLGGFDPEDLVDFWIFLDRENNNFDGNEIYIDYIAIGEKPDSTFNSPCDLPDFTSSTYELDWVSFYEVYPNPVRDRLQITFDRNLGRQEGMTLRLFNPSGQVLLQQALPLWNEQMTVDVSNLPSGLMFLQISGRRYHFTTRIVKE
ncbi:MAG: T9SS type A sorting domain-containing protein, partial [Bacteroidota bacterium]